MKEDIRQRDGYSEDIDVALNMSVIGEILETKGIMDPAITDNTEVHDVIRNFWILQYDGIGDDALLVGEPKYYPDMERFLKQESEGGEGGRVRLVRSSDKNRVVVLANTFDPLMTFPKDSDFGDLKKLARLVESEDNYLSSSGDDKYIMFNGSAEVVINGSNPVQCYLKRNVAKVSITIRNSSEDVTVNSWQIRSVPSISHYFNAYSLPETFPALSDFKTVDYPVYVPEVPLAPGSGDAAPYVTYVPLNKRGTAAGVTTEQKKNAYAIAGATFLQVNASYGNGVPIQYTFYLGENMTTDFNLLANKSYSYVFDISAKGSSVSDSRVKELGLVDFTQSEVANCYIVNPAQTAGVRREFRIPVSRVDEFWGNNGYENESNYTLGSSKSWEVKIISANFDTGGGKVSLEKSIGRGSQDYFSVTVAPDLPEDRTCGSVIVALYAGDDQACWSWHLWVTDYAPEEAFNKTPMTDIYSYAVNGGSVHRYSGNLWTSENGKYRNSFFMDRNLGALDNSSYTGSAAGSVYYQYGRKDPFFGQTTVIYGTPWSTMSYETIVAEDPEPEASIKKVVYNPLKFITTSARIAWTHHTKYNPDVFDGSIKWQDPFTSPTFVVSYNASNNKNVQRKEKSIFDPCPAGYKVPDRDMWADFRLQSATDPTTNINASSEMKRGFPDYAEFKGMYYWPSVPADYDPAQSIYFPAIGVIHEHARSTYGVGTDVYMMTAEPTSKEADNPYFKHATKTSVGDNTGLGRSHSAPVRCVTIQ